MRSYRAARREARKEPVPFQYEYTDEDGNDQTEVFTCKGEVSSLLLSEFAHNAEVETTTPEGAALLREFFAQAFGDDDEYRRFFRLHTKHGDDDLLMDILGGLVQDFSGRPTSRPSDSPATPSTTGHDSKVVSLPGGFRVEAEPMAEEPEQDQQQASSG